MRIFSFFKAVGRALFRWGITRQSQLLAEPAIEARLKVCDGCDELDVPMRFCRRCKCFVDVKAMLGTEDCPLHKWPKEGK